MVGFFIFQYAKLRLLELYYNFFTNFCDVNKLEMDTDSLHLALTEKELESCIRPEMRGNGRGCDQMTVSIVSLLMLQRNSSPEHVL